MTDCPNRPPGPIPSAALPGLLLALALAIAGCAGAPEAPPEPEPQPGVEETGPADEDISLELPPSPLRAQFNRVEQSLAAFDWMQASVALDAIPPAAMSDEDVAYRDYLRARIDWVRGDPGRALASLDSLRTTRTSAALQYRVATFRHFMLSLSADHVASARAASELLALAPAEQLPAWRRATWFDLQRAGAPALDAALAETTDPEWIAWLQLALDCRDPDSLATNLDNWLARYPEHPAADPLPGGMGYGQRARGDTVALVLPLSGRLASAGRAVLDGYLAAHYAAAEGGDSPGEVIVLDSDSYAGAGAAYDEAVRRGARMVVGPLSKQSVADLATRPSRPVPVIALNRIEGALPAAGSPLVQLSLAPEDEAATLAELAYGSGARQAMVISPAGAWGEKVERALRERWAELGGTVVSAASYTDREEYSGSVKDALGLSESERRAREIRDMLATNIEFTARRRQDPQVVFLLSRQGAEARSIKPLLAFHYAGAIPVYALSSIYNGIPDERNRDLNGINLLETPWLLGANPALRVAIAASDASVGGYTRLNALGADAFILQRRFPRLQGGPDTLLRGSTGLLTLDPELRLHRTLSLATFDRGEIRQQ